MEKTSIHRSNLMEKKIHPIYQSIFDQNVNAENIIHLANMKEKTSSIYPPCVRGGRTQPAASLFRRKKKNKIHPKNKRMGTEG
jgi:hypothetical protein